MKPTSDVRFWRFVDRDGNGWHLWTGGENDNRFTLVPFAEVA